MPNRIFVKTAVGLGLVLAIAACGDSGGGNSGIGSSQPLADSFFAEVKAMVATSPDDADSKNIDAVTATSPDDSDTVAIDS